MKSCLSAWVLGRTLAWSRLVPHYLRRERFVAFLKTFNNKCFTRPCEDLCGTALEIARPRIALSLKMQPVRFEPRTRSESSNGQTSCKVCMARLETALEQEAPKSNQKSRSHLKELVEQPWWILLQIIAIAVLQDTERLQLQKPFGMDLLHFYPLRGSLGWKPGRATQAKVRARENTKKMQKKWKEKKKKKKKKKKK